MAKNKQYVPSGMAGLANYADDGQSKYQIRPGHVIFLAIIVVAIVLFLHLQGDAIFGITQLP